MVIIRWATVSGLVSALLEWIGAAQTRCPEASEPE
jgi:hypothetical protein